MPCGTGKTFVSFLLSLEYSNIIILTPLISTTEQIHAHYKNYYSKYDNINFMLVNCKAERNISNITSKLLLVENLHKTFDKYLWSINPKTKQIIVKDCKDMKTSINQYKNKCLNLDITPYMYSNLLQHYNLFLSK